MAAVQPFISGAISKTVNMPNEATIEEIERTYVEGWKLGLKAIAIYRDGSKRTQPLVTKRADEPAEVAAPPEPAVKPEPRAMRRKLPDERQALTHKFSIAGHEGYITVGMYESGAPGEIFLTMSKEGSTISGLMDSFATAISLALQYGVPIQTLVDKFAHTRFEPSGITNNADIRFAKSIMDYIFRWLGTKFLPQEPLSEQPSLSGAADDLGAPHVESAPASPGTGVAKTQDQMVAEQERETFQNQADAPICTECGSLMVRNGACFKCLNCGSVFGCS
jgi:ribonucleoside-diphosphate reductase alpha chain